jgi:formate-dependent nitrite reductase membrane component NrfD
LMAGSAVLSNGPGPARALGDLAGLGAAATGMPLSGYTAVLLSNTAVPLWQQTRRSLPVLFVSSAMASASDLLEPMKLNGRERRIVHTFGLVGKVAELVATVAFRREASQVERVGLPLGQGIGGALIRAATACTAASLLLSVLPRRPKPLRLVAALLGTTGSVALKFGVVKAGETSTADPRATFHQQRAGRGAREVTGTAAVVGPDDRRAG